ncbi:AAEL005345-PA [Aedes aegypti]|uniref:AAEL005345-PA n=1 Tax=Aedes aegypti TaxID=7159 RepID=Q17AB5_AEDAE|nr:AAEL005345-PA [Aedes aegypti]
MTLHSENYGLIQRYASGYDCNQEKCQYENLHEHFHCYDTFCRGKVLYKKYEIIRHLKWHKKRKESLKYGFYRFSSSDDCSIQYGQCQHNHKHTHYHCVHDNCDKVYISTSDVQMHANYHRKHEAIVKNGFQRFRATEECNTDYCAFKGQKTTHFHCRRENCKYTFKNKADMEKHKTYHLKDEMLLRDGYKKFLKTEDCTYKNCRFSRVCNHIHCMHENCHYVLHSSGQLLSHKRKHERMDTEVDYRKLQMARNLLSKFGMNRDGDGSVGAKEEDEVPTSPTVGEHLAPRNPVIELLAIMSELTFRTLPLQIMLHMRMQMLQNMGYDQVFSPDNVESLKNLSESGLNDEYLKQLYKFNENICQLNERAMLDVNPTLSELAKSQSSSVSRSFANVGEHYNQFKRKLEEEAVAGPSTKIQDSTFFNTTLNKSKLLSNPSVDYRLLKKDDSGLGETLADTNSIDRQKPLLESANFLQFSSSKTLFNRKRGRPRKNHVMEVYNNAQDSPQAIFTSFKLEKNDSKAINQDYHRDGVAEQETKLNRDLHNRSDDEEGVKRHRSLSPAKMFLPMLDAPSVPMFSTPDFGGFSQILEKHMREIKTEPSATITHEMDLSSKDKSRNHLKCVVCNNSFETFADIKEHECHQAKEAEKPLLAFPPGLTMHQPTTFRSAYPPDAETSRLIYAPTPMGLPAAPSAAKESISLVKTTGTFFPDVNANKLKYF